VYYRGIPHELDLAACNRALVKREVEGAFASVAGLAKVAKVSRSTATRFLGGRRTSLGVALRMVAALGLCFEEVARPVDGIPLDAT
jgi:hypothetical protein